MTGLQLYFVEVPDDWTDHYGHLNEGYYVVAASNSFWAFQSHLGIGTDYYDETGFAMVTVETHVRYLDEVHRGDELRITNTIHGHDAKRAIFGVQMHVGERLCATMEAMCLHIDHKNGGLGPLPESVQQAFADLTPDPLPDWAGRSVGFRKKG